ncbi:hypothetical protein [Gracilibacillus sp. YIM 98692]|uniref:hypothetical protein n=1 Tax=Gracilibacillus sp. YIM 98692 TaxID=2663532 RepID=UPI0013D58320|nr:hypothetical protein [Gracilibacillus sp. YIM 98692]
MVDKYGLTEGNGVKKLLKDWDVFMEMPYSRGDYDAVVMLVDLDTAIERAGLTDKQVQAITYYRQGYKLREIGMFMDCSGTNARNFIERACSSIAGVFKTWDINGAY